MTGPTSEADQELVMHHTAELVERHEIMLPLLGVRNPNLGRYTEELAEARRRAYAWADAHGLALGDLGTLARTGFDAQGPAVGMTFTVTVGKGDIAADQSVPGVLDSWRWSGPRVEWWRVIFDRIAKGRQGRLVARQEPESTNVTQMFRTRVPGPAEPPYDPPGCTCRISGPFRELCPIHFDR